MTLLAITSFAALIVLIVFGIPIGLSLITVGVVGLLSLGNVSAALTQVTLIFWEQGNSFLLISLPFYILMGGLINHTGIASNLYRCASLWLSWLPGGLGIASVMACAGFGAVSGSSTATARTMGAIVIPQMLRHGYGPRLSTGVISASGTLGILIPPSIILVFYGIMTETSIGSLFVAGIVPGLIIAAIFSVIVLGTALISPAQAGRDTPSEAVTWSERFRSLAHVFPVIAIFGIILGGLYGGVFTPTEASAFGVFSVLVYGFLSGKLTWRAVRLALEDATLTTTVLFVIIIGGHLFTRFLAQTGMMGALLDWIVMLDLGYWQFVLAITVFYLILGCILDLFGMLILTVPLLFPVTQQMGIDPVWFGIYIVVIAEVALITPPIGVNVYVIQSVAGDIPIGQIFRGCLPFVIGMLLFVGVLAAYPDITLFLIR